VSWREARILFDPMPVWISEFQRIKKHIYRRLCPKELSPSTPGRRINEWSV
jgi:hypothetical protein